MFIAAIRKENRIGDMTKSMNQKREDQQNLEFWSQFEQALHGKIKFGPTHKTARPEKARWKIDGALPASKS